MTTHHQAIRNKGLFTAVSRWNDLLPEPEGGVCHIEDAAEVEKMQGVEGETWALGSGLWGGHSISPRNTGGAWR